MKCLILAILGAVMSAGVLADTVSFDGETVGRLPAGWVSGVTGKGNPKWAIAADPSAPGNSKVLIQSGEGTFPWCVKRDVQLTDGYVEVKFKPLSGREDQAGGVMWRWKDGDNYYVARANALEDNVSLYRTEGATRNTIKYVDAPVAKSRWHTLRVEFAGTRIQVYLNGKRYIDQEDSHISGPGAVGVWTKADSVTAFDEFKYGGN